MSDFGEVVDLTANIESILKRYPFSIGIFRELLQNSDDAKATSQTFVLDLRTHGASRLLDEKLSVLQGPALLAYNNATFNSDDWEALQNISRSSKKTDTSKIGKYGIGIRSCYHLTDNLEILSGDSLVIFDPHRSLIASGGKKWSLEEVEDQYPEQLLPFRHFLTGVSTSFFEGTIIRLPLRMHAQSRLSTKVPQPEEIRKLLMEFVEEELPLVMLFLSSVIDIEVLEIDDFGVRPIGKGHIERKLSTTACSLGNDVPVQSIGTTIHLQCYASDGSLAQSKTHDWHILHASFPQSLCVDALRQRLGSNGDYDVLSDVDSEKLCPSTGSPVAIAIPLSLQRASMPDGRLFTYLPLPLKTGFPCHIHALFALTDSRDHLRNGGEIILERTRDKLLVEWNRVLFEHFIPKLWAALLQDLSENELIGDIYRAWPPAQPEISSGESAYWQNIAITVLRNILEQCLAVWPLVTTVDDREQTSDLVKTPNSGRVYRALSDTLLAEPDIASSVLDSLARAAINVTKPPAYVFQLLRASDACLADVLTPETARNAMLNRDYPSLSALPASDREVILQYLLSANDISLFAGLPLIPTVGGNFVSLKLTSSGDAEIHTLLSAQEDALFGQFDPKAIALHQLPHIVAECLSDHGEKLLNVVNLTCAKVVEYLRRKLGVAQGSSLTHPTTVDMIPFLLELWRWLPLWTKRDQFVEDNQSSDLSLLPTMNGELREMRQGIFAATTTMEGQLQDELCAFGLSFIHPLFPLAALKPLTEYKIVKNPFHASDILDNMSTDVNYRPEEEAAHRLQEHLSSCLEKSGRLTAAQKLRLRSLPFYGLLSSVQHQDRWSVESHIGAIPAAASILCVAAPSPDLLPRIPNVVFLASSDCQRAILEHIELAAATRELKEADLMSLAIEHFSLQTPEMQLAFLKRLVEKPEFLAFSERESLKHTAFIAVGDGSQYLSPKDIIDPNTDIADLVLPEESRWPDRNGIYWSMTVCLGRLGLLSTQLSADFVHERISYISGLRSTSEAETTRADLARRLIQALNQSSFDVSRLQSHRLQLQWLPTSQGLRTPATCRDQVDCHLFDRVVPMVDVAVGQPLRRILGWHQLVPLSTIKEQFDAIIPEGDNVKYLYRMLLELGLRVQDMGPYLDEFRQVVRDRPWVPISWKPIVVPTHEAVFTLTTALDGFHLIPLELAQDSGVRTFMMEMGCTESPSTVAILRRIADMKTVQPLSHSSVRRVIKLLKAVQFDDSGSLDPYRSDLLVPDVDGILRTPNEVYYNDLGSRSCHLQLPSDQHPTHCDLGDDVARQLGIHSLSSLHLMALDPDDEDMYEDVTLRISSVLKAYGIEQAFNEFLANAADAKADQFNILLDNKNAKLAGLGFLSPQMRQFASGPSLIIHNDSIFQEQDFKGIRRIGLGGKQNNQDAIGKFGLGALTMFHFSEVPMIVSGRFAQFLDPGRTYLPPEGSRGRSAWRIPLATLRSLYNGHLAPLDAMFGFSSDADFYEGTLFYLPLRTEDQARRSRLSQRSLSSHDVQNLIQTYEATALQSLLFIGVTHITAWMRPTHSNRRQFWEISARREPSCPEPQDKYVCHRIRITCGPPTNPVSSREWNVVQSQYSVQDVPTEYKMLTTKHQVKTLNMGIAGMISQTEEKECYRFFSKLPLPVSTSLPVHVDASFILADDRRSIRFDDNGQSLLETRFNRWILAELIPRLYLYLLETWPLANSNLLAWPGSPPEQALEDPLSRAVSDSFYRSLPDSCRKVCHTVVDQRFLPGEVLFLRDDHSAVGRLLLLIRPQNLTRLPDNVIKKIVDTQSTIRWVMAKDLRDIILEHRDAIIQSYGSKKISAVDVQDIIRYLSEVDISYLIGLPLLPFADGSLGEFATSSDPKVYTRRWPSLKQQSWHSPFPPNRFLDPRVVLTHLLEKGLNVAELTGAGVAELIQERVPKSKSTLLDASEEEQKWIEEFWSHFDDLDVTVDYRDISSLALVPTTRAGRFVSMDHCGSRIVFASPSSSDKLSDVCQIMEKLGAISIQEAAQLPPKLLRLGGPTPMALSLLSVLEFFLGICGNDVPGILPSLFDKLSREEVEVFAQWARPEMRSYSTHLAENRAHLISIASNLPIWPARRAGEADLRSLLTPGGKILTAPFKILDLIPFLPTKHHFLEVPRLVLTSLSVQPISLAELITDLNHNNCYVLDSRDFPRYKRILDAVLQSNPQADEARSFRVPNASGRLVEVNTLYARQVPVFREVFDTRLLARHLIHQDFSSYETPLKAFGLNHERDYASFKRCAQVLHNESAAPDLVRRATAVFEWFQELPMQIGGDKYKWRELAGFRFIPRDRTRRHFIDNGIATDSYTTPLPDVIAPKEVLRPEYEKIAWTQRGLFLNAPHERVLLADLSLGVPTAEEVVEHMCVLSQRVSVNHLGHGELLEDLLETYRWLNQHSEDAKQHLLEHHADPLFLNIDTPNDPWRFSCASQLVFNAPDEGDRQYIRAILLPYKDLLLSAGAYEIKQPTTPTIARSSADDALSRLRLSLNEQRIQQQFTDAVLISADGTEFFVHRSFLGASNEYFMDLFCKAGLRESSSAVSPSNPVQIRLEEGRASIECALVYLYTGEVRIAERHDQDELLSSLRLAHYWMMRDLFVEIQALLVETLTPGTYSHLLEEATSLQAELLLEKCREYERDNFRVFRQIAEFSEPLVVSDA